MQPIYTSIDVVAAIHKSFAAYIAVLCFFISKQFLFISNKKFLKKDDLFTEMFSHVKSDHVRK